MHIYDPASPRTLIQLLYVMRKRDCSNLYLKSDLKLYGLLARFLLEYLSVAHRPLQYMKIPHRQQENSLTRSLCWRMRGFVVVS